MTRAGAHRRSILDAADHRTFAPLRPASRARARRCDRARRSFSRVRVASTARRSRSARRAPPPPPAQAAPAGARAARRSARADLHGQARRHALRRSRSTTASTTASSRRGTTSTNLNVMRIGQVLRLTAPGSDRAAIGATGVTTTPLQAPVRRSTRANRAPRARRRAGAPSPPPSGRATPTTYKIAAEGGEGALLGAGAGAMRSARLRRTASRVAAAPAEPRRAVQPSAARAACRAVARRTDRAATDDDDKLDWMWPAKGKVVTGFSETANLKGIDIAGKAGQPVDRQRRGQGRLRGHRDCAATASSSSSSTTSTYLSAYAHNREILVKEGQQVATGPEDRRDGQHRRRSGEAALRNPAAGQAGGSREVPAARMSATARRGAAADDERAKSARWRAEPDTQTQTCRFDPPPVGCRRGFRHRRHAALPQRRRAARAFVARRGAAPCARVPAGRLRRAADDDRAQPAARRQHREALHEPRNPG